MIKLRHIASCTVAAAAALILLACSSGSGPASPGRCVEIASGQVCGDCIPQVTSDWVIRTADQHAALFACDGCRFGLSLPPVPSPGEVLIVSSFFEACPTCLDFACAGQGSSGSTQTVVLTAGASDCDAEPSYHASWILLRDFGQPVSVIRQTVCP